MVMCMKKILMLLFLTVLTICITGCSKYKGYTEISYTDLQTKLQNKESFVFVIGSSTCSACAKYETTMKKVIKKYQVEVFFIDINKLSLSEQPNFESKFVISGTPTTVFVKDGVETSAYDRINGAGNYSEIISTFKKQGIIGD